MCRRNTATQNRRLTTLALPLAVIAGLCLDAQVARPDWRHVGSAGIDLSLAGIATGAVDRVWFSEDGNRLYAKTHSGRTFVTSDLENWKIAPADRPAPPEKRNDVATTLPETSAKVQSASATRLYATGRFAYRSDDSGATWQNLTGYHNTSLIGDGLADLAVSPRDPNVIVAAVGTGVWRSADAGVSWVSLNDTLPNLAVHRLLGFPANTHGVRIAAQDVTGLDTLEWMPGEKQAWRATMDREFTRDTELKQSLTQTLGAPITAVAGSGDTMYAGSADGRLWTSADRGATWQPSPDRFAAAVEQIVADTKDPRLALVALGARLSGTPISVKTPHVLRTISAGAVWDDLTANLPDVAAHGISEDRITGAVYVATDQGLYVTFADLVNAGPATQWSALDGLPGTPVTDVRLDPSGNQLYAAVDGYGVYAAPAPHRFRDPRIVNAADFSNRPAAPGSLLSVLGANVRSVRTGDLTAPVLSATDAKSEIQVPFEASGTSLSLALQAANGTLTLGVPLQSTSPAIFVDGDGAPVLLDADSGVMLDAMTPARTNARLQILATGLGRVTPDWPTGMPAPVDNAPRVLAPVHVYLDRNPVEVTKATLAPGYIGFYLIEVQLPKIVNYGPAELYIDADGQTSNRVRVWIEP